MRGDSQQPFCLIHASICSDGNYSVSSNLKPLTAPSLPRKNHSKKATNLFPLVFLSGWHERSTFTPPFKCVVPSLIGWNWWCIGPFSFYLYMGFVRQRIAVQFYIFFFNLIACLTVGIRIWGATTTNQAHVKHACIARVCRTSWQAL